MSAGVEKRLAKMEQITEPMREVVRHNRKVMLSMVEMLKQKSNMTEEEARQYILRSHPPELAAHLADDWETNPLTLETVKLLSRPDGHIKLLEKGIEHMAAAEGFTFDDWLRLTLRYGSDSLELKLNFIRIAHRRKLPRVVVKLHDENPLDDVAADAENTAG